MSIDVSKFSRYSTPSDSLGFLLRQLFMLWRRSVESGLARIDLTHMQFVLLIGLGWLTRNGESVRQFELGRFCKSSRALTSQTLTTLIRKKLVVRVPDPMDGRSNLLRLSPAGERKLREAVPVLEAVEERFLASDAGLHAQLERDLRQALTIELAVAGDPEFADDFAEGGPSAR
jgi:DNA-binding MarR family transcriptional regulator